MTVDIARLIDDAWEARTTADFDTAKVRGAVEAALDGLDSGHYRIAEKIDGSWIVHQWLKKAVLMSFRFSENHLIDGGPNGATWWDKVDSKFAGWDAEHFMEAGFRAVPGAFVRRAVYIAKSAVVMPSFINIGAYIGEGTMVDIGAAIGSCAQIGAHCHISANAVIGGVLEPLQAEPVIIEDNAFVGTAAQIAEGAIIGEGAVISMGVVIGASTKIVDRETGAISYGRVPPYSVVVSGSLPGKAGQPSLYCAVIVKKVDAKTRSKTSINELLRD
ncbi:MAG: 2,3,4,5-tetrahydropyridine-2,6-dicarboxylate N-succinyltransferase [Rhizomicrobium sp.]